MSGGFGYIVAGLVLGWLIGFTHGIDWRRP
jgi:hypothetical protein